MIFDKINFVFCCNTGRKNYDRNLKFSQNIYNSNIINTCDEIFRLL